MDGSRLIMVGGMYHSGTTIAAHVLSQHPDVLPATDGGAACWYENNWLPERKAGPIRHLITAHLARRLLLKNIWHDDFDDAWVRETFPAARQVYVWRSFQAICESWHKPKSLAPPELKYGGTNECRYYYVQGWRRAMAWHGAILLSHAELIAEPEAQMEPAASFVVSGQ